MNAITELEKLGYTFTLEGEKIRYQHNGVLVENEERVKSLLAELKANKSEAIRFLLGRLAISTEKANPVSDFCQARIAYFAPLAENALSESYKKMWQSQTDYYKGILASMN
jgi:hypothetical protein